MTNRFLAIVVAVVGLAAQGCVVSRQAVTPLGRQVTLAPVLDAPLDAVSGELMAVSADSVWLAPDSGIVGIPWTGVERVHVRISRVKGSHGFAYSAILGAVTGGALFVACLQEGDSCGGILPASVLWWMLWGGISAPSIDASARPGFTVENWELLRGYARFPQGLPAGVTSPR